MDSSTSAPAQAAAPASRRHAMSALGRRPGGHEGPGRLRLRGRTQRGEEGSLCGGSASLAKHLRFQHLVSDPSFVLTAHPAGADAMRHGARRAEGFLMSPSDLPKYENK